MTHLLSHARLAAWADSRLLPALLVVLLAVDVLVGVNWLLSPPSDLTSVAYSAAKAWLDMSTWGALFFAAGTGAAAALLAGGRGRAGYAMLPAAGLWGLWTVLFTWAAMLPGASWVGVVFSTALWVLHLIAGLAATHLPTTASATVRR